MASVSLGWPEPLNNTAICAHHMYEELLASLASRREDSDRQELQTQQKEAICRCITLVISIRRLSAAFSMSDFVSVQEVLNSREDPECAMGLTAAFKNSLASITEAWSAIFVIVKASSRMR